MMSRERNSWIDAKKKHQSKPTSSSDAKKLYYSTPDSSLEEKKMLQSKFDNWLDEKTMPESKSDNWLEQKKKRQSKSTLDEIPSIQSKSDNRLQENKTTGMSEVHPSSKSSDKGRVVRLIGDEEFGYLSSEREENAGRSAGGDEMQKDVFFRFGARYKGTLTGFMSLKLGDVLEYITNEDPVKPKAVFARLVWCAPRSSKMKASYLESVIDKCRENPELVLREITKCPAGMLLVLADPKPTLQMTLSILELADTLSNWREARLYSSRLKDFFRLFAGSEFLTSIGALRRWMDVWRRKKKHDDDESSGLSDSSEETGVANPIHLVLRMVQRLILRLLEYFPKILSSMLPLLHDLAQCTAEEESVHSPTRSTSYPNSDLRSNNGFLLDVLEVLANVAAGEDLNLTWEKVPLLPVDSELRGRGRVPEASDLQLPVINKKGGYESSGTYLDTYFRLLREDCFASVKKGILAFKAGRLDDRDMRVWIKASPIGVVFGKTYPGLIIALECSLSGGKYGITNVVLPMPGSLLCICDDGGNFYSPIWAVLVGSEKAERVILFVEVVEGRGSESNKDSEACLVSRVLRGRGMFIAESPTYYKAFHPVLKALQRVDPQTIPFEDELVRLQLPARRNPDYLNEATILNWSCLFTGGSTRSEVIKAGISALDWLQLLYETTLDASQIHAVKHALTSRLSLIQGPPGTGKTFLGVKILELLLTASTLPCQPILVLTYKNQALDQFLESCLKFCNGHGDLVRVGGRSTSVTLKNHNLHSMIVNADDFSSDWRDNCRKLENLQIEMEKVLEHLQNSNLFLSITVHAPEWLLRQFFSRRASDRELLKSVPEGIPINEALRDGIADISHDVSSQLRRALLENLKAWVPNERVFTLVQNCLAIRRSCKDSRQPYIPENGFDEPEQGKPIDLEEENKERSALEEDWRAIGYEGKRETSSLQRKIIRFQSRPIDTLLPNFELFDLDVQKYESLLQSNPWELPDELRCILIAVIMKKSAEAALSQLPELKERYDCICRDNDEIIKRRRVKVLQNAKVIGMTTTGAAMNHDILEILSPGIIIVEEAAEILEAHILAILRPTVQHCILIGDHCQLRPSVESYELDYRHNLGVSMFERLVESKRIPFKALSLQCRMRDEFLPLLLPIYPELRSKLELVSGDKNRPPSCMKKSMFFWTHSYKETMQRSFANEGEAQMVVALVKWLVAEGNKPEQITVLGAYNGQVSLLRQKLKDGQETGAVDVYTIDKFQGSENQIVIVSPVRSNPEGRVGHLALRNRLCVSVSRARSALYLCGNDATLIKGSADWKTIIECFKLQGCLGSTILLQCPRHLDTPPFGIDSKDAASFVPKLCTKPCQFLFHCGHLCSETCHDGEHPMCKEEIEYACTNCAQKLTRLCSEDVSQKLCHNMVWLRLESCGHIKECRCWEKQNQVHSASKCDKICGKILECGHGCVLLCSENCTSTPCKPCADRKKEIAIKELQQKLQDTERQLKEIESNRKDGFLIEEVTEDGENADEYHWVKDRTEKYIQPTHKIFPRVTKIEKIRNLTLQKLFLEAHRDLIKPTKPSQHLFHGTDDKAIQDIAKNGFRLPQSDRQKNMFGRGCYFATDSSKSAQSLYTKGSNKLLLCEVLLGQTWKVEQAMPHLDLKTVRKKSYDSVFSIRDSEDSGGTAYDEFVIYNPHQAIPRYIVHYVNEDGRSPLYSDLQKHATGNFSRKPLKPSWRFSGDLFAEYHFRLAESQFLRMSASKSKVNMVEVIYNAELEGRYKSMKASFAAAKKPTEEMLVFHGTNTESIEKIIKEGFKIGGEGVPIRCGDAYGKGVYTAVNPEISIPYSRGTGMMLLSLALLGAAGVDHKEGGSDNVLVIQHVDQLLPMYIVHFSEHP